MGVVSTQLHLTREGSIHPLVHSYTWAPSNVHLLISLHSGRLSHLEMVFCPSLFPPTQQWLKERSQAPFEPPHLCAQVQLCFWFINSFLTRSSPVLYPFSNMWHAERDGEFSLIHADGLMSQHSDWESHDCPLTAAFTSVKYECQFWTLTSTLLGEICILIIQI